MRTLHHVSTFHLSVPCQIAREVVNLSAQPSHARPGRNQCDFQLKFSTRMGKPGLLSLPSPPTLTYGHTATAMHEIEYISPIECTLPPTLGLWGA